MNEKVKAVGGFLIVLMFVIFFYGIWGDWEITKKLILSDFLLIIFCAILDKVTE